MTSPLLGYVILYVDELDRALALYTDVLGFTERRRMGPYAELETGVTTLALSERAFVAEHLLGELPPPGQGSSEIGVVVERDQVELLYRAALLAGCESIKEPAQQPWGQLVSYVRDPDGHLVEICSPVEASGELP